jgi:hypothetical protein
MADKDRLRRRNTRLKVEALKYRAALQQIAQWDVLNPPRSDLLADLPWLKQLVDDALAGPSSLGSS